MKGLISMLAIKLTTIVAPIIHTAYRTISPIFQNDFLFFNKIHQIYTNIHNAITAPFHQMFFETIPMGYIYLMIIGYMFAPLLGKLIGLLINRLIGNKAVKGA